MAISRRELGDLAERAKKVQLPTYRSAGEIEAERVAAAARHIDGYRQDSDAWSELSDEERGEYVRTHPRHQLGPHAWRLSRLADEVADPAMAPWSTAVAEHQQRERALSRAESWRGDQLRRWNADMQRGAPPQADPLVDPDGHQRRQDFERRLAWVGRLEQASGDDLLGMFDRSSQPLPEPAAEDDEPPAPISRPELR